MSRIDLNIVATGNFSQVETSITRLRAQVAALNAQVATMGGINPTQIRNIQSYADSFNAAIDQSGMFERHMVSMSNETQKFGRNLEQGRLRLKEYVGAIRDYRRQGIGQIRQLAREQVRMMNATTMMMPDGRAQVIVPKGIDEAIDKQKILNQEYRIFRQTVQGASTELINWGKNTQWAGRQLTVGLTVPLTIFGAVAGKMFMDVDKELTRLAKVYGGTAGEIASPQAIAKIREETQLLSRELAASLGVAASETAGLAADIAATGKEGAELIGSTRESIRLSVLGEVDRQEAMRATLAIQNVFKKNTEELADTINFLNAVENQTSTSLQDLVTGIVKAGPVVDGLGGSVEDLAVMLVAMREGGVTASEAANAIKSSLASLINPTAQTKELFKDFGIDLKGIVDKNAGDLIGTLTNLQDELGKLDELSRQRAIEQLFGKFQFARINALLSNLGRAGSQTEEVFKLAGISAEQLAQTADAELQTLTESATMRFTRALESIKANLVPIGETFVEVGTMLLNVANKVFEIFNSLPEPVQNFVKGMGFLVALAGPIIMITGVLGNFLGYLLKGVSALMAMKKAGRGVFQAYTPESIAARTATELMTQASYNQVEAISALSSAIDILNQKLSATSFAMDDVAQSSAGVMASAEASAMSIYSAPGYGPEISQGKLGGLVRPHYWSSAAMRDETELPPGLAGLKPEQRAKGLRSQHGFAGVGEIAYIQGLFSNTPAIYSNEDEMQAFRSRIVTAIESKNLGVDPDVALQSVAASRPQYIARQSEFIGRIEALTELPASTLQELSEELGRASARGENIAERGEVLVRQAIEQDANATARYIRTKEQVHRDLAAMTMDTPEFARAAGIYVGERETQARVGRGGLVSKGFTAEIGESLNSNVQTSMISLGSQYAADAGTAIKTATAMVKGTSARTALREGRKAGLKLVRVSNAQGMRYIIDTTNGLERAVVYSIDQSTGQIKGILQGAARKKVLAGSQTRAALARHEAAVTRLDAMTLADVNHSALVTEIAAGQTTPGTPVPGRFRRMGSALGRAARGPAGMGVLGSLSMLSMFGTSEPGAQNTAMDIAGGAGMGAAMGMMAGPKGAALGAIIGTMVGTVTSANSNMDRVRENAKELADSMSVGAKSLNETAEFFGGKLRADRASAAKVLEGSGIREQQLTKGQEYLATEAGQKFVDGFSKGINSYGFNNALEGVSNTMANMIMQGAMSFEDAEGVAAALAEQLNMPTLTAEVVGELRNIMGPDGRNILERPITVGIRLQEESMRQAAQAQAVVLEQELGNIEPTFTNIVGFAALATLIGPIAFAAAALADADVPVISAIGRNLTAIGNEDYATAIEGVSTLGRMIGNQLRSAYDNINSAKQRYNELEKEARAMEKGPEKKRLLAILDTEKRKIQELEQTYETMRRQASANFQGLLQENEGMAAEYLGSMKTSIEEMFEGTVEQPAAQMLTSLISGMDKQLQADIMLNISSGQMSPTAAMSLITLLGGDEGAAKTLDVILRTQGVTDTNKFLLTAMQIEDEEIRKQLILEFASEGSPGAGIIAAGLTPEREAELESAVAEAQAVIDNTKNAYSGLDEDDLNELLAEEYAALDAATSALAAFREERNKLMSESMRGPSHLVGDDLSADAQTVADYKLALQELGKLNVSPSFDLSQTNITEDALRQVVTVLDQIRALPDEIVKSIDMDVAQANANSEDFLINWDKIDGKKDLVKNVLGVDKFSDVFGAFNISYKAFDALPDIVKSVILHYVTMYQSITMAFRSAVEVGRNATGVAYKEANKAAAQASLAMQAAQKAVADAFGASQDSGYLPDTTPDTTIPETDSGGGGGGGGKKENPYRDLIDAQREYIDNIRKEREERQRILRLQEESLNFMLKQQGLQNQIARAKAEGNFAEAALLQAQKDTERQIRQRELAEDRRQRQEDREIEKRQQIIDILEKGGEFADKIAAALKQIPDAIPSELGGDSIGKNKGKGKGKNKKRGGLRLIGDPDELYLIEKNMGGFITGPGNSISDSIPAMLSNGEYVIKASSVKKYGVNFLDALNSGRLQKLRMGGMSSSYPDRVSRMASGGLAMYNNGGYVSPENSSYNVTVNVAGTNASANDIADEVLRSLERRDRMKRTVTRI